MDLGNPSKTIMIGGWLVLVIIIIFFGKCTIVYGYTLGITFDKSWH